MAIDSSCTLLCSHSTNIDVHDWCNSQEQEYGQCTGQASILKIEQLVVKLHANHVGMIVAASHDIDNVKDLENINDHSGSNKSHSWSDHGDCNVPEQCHATRTIDFCCFNNVIGNIFQASGDDHHAKASPHPDIHQDQREVIDCRIDQPDLRGKLEKRQDRI